MRGRDTLLIDLRGDLPATMGMAEPSRPGINDWLGENVTTDAASLVLLGDAVVDGLVLVHRGSQFVDGRPRWEQFARAIASIPHHVVIDAGTDYVPAELAAAVDSITMVTKPCYLSLRRATHMPRPHNVVVVKEEGRALTPQDVSHVLGAPVVAEVPHVAAVSRAVDAGLLPSRVAQLFPRQFDQLLAS